METETSYLRLRLKALSLESNFTNWFSYLKKYWKWPFLSRSEFTFSLRTVPNRKQEPMLYWLAQPPRWALTQIITLNPGQNSFGKRGTEKLLRGHRCSHVCKLYALRKFYSQDQESYRSWSRNRILRLTTQILRLTNQNQCFEFICDSASAILLSSYCNRWLSPKELKEQTMSQHPQNALIHSHVERQVSSLLPSLRACAGRGWETASVLWQNSLSCFCKI